jgi:hypothetical protein
MSSVFVSWSGEPSRTVARFLKEWLPTVIGELEPWMSHEDIHAGVRWSDEVSSALARTDFGIICVTEVNGASPWLNFEAGALATRLESGRVFPYLIGIPTGGVQGPLAQFQGAPADREGTLKLLLGISRLMTPPPDPQRVRTAFDERWRSLQALLADLPEPSEQLASEGLGWPRVRTAESLGAFLSRMSDPQRLILTHLLSGPASLEDLADALEMEVAELSYRCKDLEHNELIEVLGMTTMSYALTERVQRLLQKAPDEVARLLPQPAGGGAGVRGRRGGLWRRMLSGLRGDP